LIEEQSPKFEAWRQALDALSAVVKLFANDTLRLPAVTRELTGTTRNT
jgi:hypothetical protein